MFLNSVTEICNSITVRRVRVRARARVRVRVSISLRLSVRVYKLPTGECE